MRTILLPRKAGLPLVDLGIPVVVVTLVISAPVSLSSLFLSALVPPYHAAVSQGAAGLISPGSGCIHDRCRTGSDTAQRTHPDHRPAHGGWRSRRKDGALLTAYLPSSPARVEEGIVTTLLPGYEQPSWLTGTPARDQQKDPAHEERGGADRPPFRCTPRPLAPLPGQELGCHPMER